MMSQRGPCNSAEGGHGGFLNRTNWFWIRFQPFWHKLFQSSKFNLSTIYTVHIVCLTINVFGLQRKLRGNHVKLRYCISCDVEWSGSMALLQTRSETFL